MVNGEFTRNIFFTDKNYLKFMEFSARWMLAPSSWENHCASHLRDLHVDSMIMMMGFLVVVVFIN